MIGPVTTPPPGSVHSVRLKPSGVELPAPPRQSSAAELTANVPPVDTDRVTTLRAAIAEGRYDVDPHTIADRMIDSDLSDR